MRRETLGFRLPLYSHMRPAVSSIVYNCQRRRLADLERRRQRRSGAVDGERRRQAITTEARRSGEAEAGSNDGGSPIWSGLAMTIWSGGSRAAEAAAEDVQRRRHGQRRVRARGE
ncbi:uncharacterized protein HKW66_Vig0227940 [Vigna angularis]|uniref:Uncharacterized protein n=1 Tax=Phaseolus angularis TaxID=3914 RepID=A0A8T0KB84_PHAAN|nr:uncharacterized protein HKW66_Vig0227940 [Vigna angularis]